MESDCAQNEFSSEEFSFDDTVAGLLLEHLSGLLRQHFESVATTLPASAPNAFTREINNFNTLTKLEFLRKDSNKALGFCTKLKNIRAVVRSLQEKGVLMSFQHPACVFNVAAPQTTKAH